MSINLRLWANIIAVLLALTLSFQNWQTSVVINFLGTRTEPFPLGLGLLMAIFIGALLAVFFAQSP